MQPEPRTYITRGGEVREVPTPMPKSRNTAPINGGMSTTARITARAKADLKAGVHPATRIALLADPGDKRCGNCAHHQSHEWYGSRKKIYHKCDIHRLGMSHGAASDIRLMWPACTAWAPEQKAE